MADHSKPTNSSTYADYTTQIDARFDDLAVGMDPALVTPTNMPTGSIRWVASSKRWEKWSGTAWAEMSSEYLINVVAPTTHAATSKTTPVDADEIPLADSAASFGLKRLTWSNLKAGVKTYLEGITLSLLNVGAGTAASPSLQIGSTDDGLYSSSGGIGFAIGGIHHSSITSTGAISIPSTNIWNISTTTAIESHAQNTTNTSAATAATYGMLLNYTSAPVNLVGAYTQLLSQSIFNGPTGTIGQVRGVSSSIILGASNLSTITTAINYDTGIAVNAGTITTGIGFRAVATIGTTSTTSYGFQGLLAADIGKWNLYMSGTAINYLAGSLLIGNATDDGANKLQVTGSAKITAAILKGVDAPITVNTILPQTQIWGINSGTNASQVLGISGANGSGPITYFVKTRGTNPGDFGAVSSGDQLGGLLWMVDDGVDYNNSAAFLRSYAEQNATANFCPSYLQFGTNSGVQTATEKMRITGSGNVLIGSTVDDTVNKLQVTGSADISGGLNTRSITATTSTTLSPAPASYDLHCRTAQASNLTINAPATTPLEGTRYTLRLKASSTYTITWNAIYRAIGVTLPTAFVTNKTVYVEMVYNATDVKWDVIDVKQEV